MRWEKRRPKEQYPDLPSPEDLLDSRGSAPGDVRSARPARRKKRRGCIWGLLMILIVAVAVTAAMLDILERSRSESSATRSEPP